MLPSGKSSGSCATGIQERLNTSHQIIGLPSFIQYTTPSTQKFSKEKWYLSFLSLSHSQLHAHFYLSSFLVSSRFRVSLPPPPLSLPFAPFVKSEPMPWQSKGQLSCFSRWMYAPVFFIFFHIRSVCSWNYSTHTHTSWMKEKWIVCVVFLK